MEANKKKILVVEDDGSLLDLLKDELNSAGFEVFTAKDGEDGLSTALKVVPDLMLVDILMPKLNGISMLKEMRKNQSLANTPAVVLTNLNDSPTIQQALETGAYDFLVKSDWDPQNLVKRLKEKVGMP